MDVITYGAVEELKADLSLVEEKINQIKNTADTLNTNMNATKANSDDTKNKVTQLLSNNVNHGSKDITTPGTTSWTCPNGVYYVYAVVHSASGGGGGSAGTGNGTSPATSSGGGGGSGAEWFGIIPVTPGRVYSLVVGAGGSGGAMGYANGTVPISGYFCGSYSGLHWEYNLGHNGGSGGAGGNSSFGGIVTCIGGGGGGGSTSTQLNYISCASYSAVINSSAGSSGSGGYITYSNKRMPWIRITTGKSGSGQSGGSDGYISGGSGGNGASAGGSQTSIGNNGNSGKPGSNGFIYFVW